MIEVLKLLNNLPSQFSHYQQKQYDLVKKFYEKKIIDVDFVSKWYQLLYENTKDREREFGKYKQLIKQILIFIIAFFSISIVTIYLTPLSNTSKLKELDNNTKSIEAEGNLSQTSNFALLEKYKSILKNTDKSQWSSAVSKLEEYETLDAEAMLLLGASYYSGEGGIKQDYAIACKWLKKSFEAGNKQAESLFKQSKFCENEENEL